MSGSLLDCWLELEIKLQKVENYDFHLELNVRRSSNIRIEKIDKNWGKIDSKVKTETKKRKNHTLTGKILIW